MPINWADLINTGAQIAGNAAAGRAQGRAQESAANNARDVTANSLYQTAQNAQMQAANLDLARRQFAEQAASSRAKQATVGDLLSRLQDVSINVPGIKTASITGGLRPSAMGDVGRLANATLAKQALVKQMEGDQFQGGDILQAPTQSAMPKANALDSILSNLGLGGSLAGAVMSSRTPAPMSEIPGLPQIYSGVPAGIGQEMPLPSYIPKAGSTNAGGIDPTLILQWLSQGQE